jgi:hypothetical protein
MFKWPSLHKNWQDFVRLSELTSLCYVGRWVEGLQKTTKTGQPASGPTDFRTWDTPAYAAGYVTEVTCAWTPRSSSQVTGFDFRQRANFLH